MIATIPPMGELLDSKYFMFLFLPETFCYTEHEYISRWKEKTVKTKIPDSQASPKIFKIMELVIVGLIIQ